MYAQRHRVTRLPSDLPLRAAAARRPPTQLSRIRPPRRAHHTVLKIGVIQDPFTDFRAIRFSLVLLFTRITNKENMNLYNATALTEPLNEVSATRYTAEQIRHVFAGHVETAWSSPTAEFRKYSGSELQTVGPLTAVQ